MILTHIWADSNEEQECDAGKMNAVKIFGLNL